MRKLVLLMSALLVLLAASFVSPIGALAASSPQSPGSPGPHSGARSSPVHVPSTRVPATASIPASVTCDGGFDAVASPNGTGNNILVSTSAVAANDVWAVGNSTIAGPFDQTLAEHWDGTTWSIVPTPNPGSTDNDLNGVAAISSNDVWVVGNYFDSLIGAWLEFAAHWNGSSWTTTIFNYGFLFGVTALASNNVWAVGTTFFSPFTTVILHWDGSTWSVVTSQSPAAYDNELFAISAFSSTDIWAVGEQESVSSGPLQSLAEHWNGTAWTTITTPNLGAGADNEIIGVNALEAGHAVGVGYGNFVSGSSPRRGEAWDLAASGTSTSLNEIGPGAGDNALLGVARSGGSVWAVGYWRNTTSSARQTLVISATWDSTGHSLIWVSNGTSDSPSAINNALYAVSAISPYAFWATGYATNAGGVDQTLTESYCALHFSLSASASTTAGSTFPLTVAAQNANSTTATGYRGTVHFTSSDPGAVLPADYAFTSLDSGSHTFAGVVLNTTGIQTITAADTVTPFVTGTATIKVLCRGACPGPAGTPGARSANPGPAGTPGSRAGANQSGAGTGGPRLPKLGALPQSAASAPGVALAPGMGSASQAIVAPPAVAPPAVAPPAVAPPAFSQSKQVNTNTLQARPMQPRESVVLAGTMVPTSSSQPSDNRSGLALALMPLAVLSLALLWARRRNNWRLNG